MVAVVVALLAVVVAACGGAGSLGTGPGCAGGCPTGQACAFAIADGCLAQGRCVDIPKPEPCNAICELHGCGCYGGTVSWAGCCTPSMPQGYAPAPVTGSQTCP